MNREFRDLAGMKFGTFTAIERASNGATENGHKFLRWKCICECGHEEIISADSLLKRRRLHCKACGKTVSVSNATMISTRNPTQIKAKVGDKMRVKGEIWTLIYKTEHFGRFEGRHGFTQCWSWSEVEIYMKGAEAQKRNEK